MIKGPEAAGERGSERKYLPKTQEIIDKLRDNPKLGFSCALDRDADDAEPAVGIYELPGGCVALPGVETQALCPQHVLTDGSFEGMTLIVDLSNGGEWSKYRGQQPDYWMKCDPNSGEVAMVAITEEPVLS